MLNIIAILLTIYSTAQVCLGISIIIGKFEPLLPAERKKLPAKKRKKARMLNAISMFVTSAAFYVLSIGILLGIDALLIVSAILIFTFLPILLIVGIKLEYKYLKKS